LQKICQNFEIPQAAKILKNSLFSFFSKRKRKKEKEKVYIFKKKKKKRKKRTIILIYIYVLNKKFTFSIFPIDLKFFFKFCSKSADNGTFSASAFFL
jgi:hypothetical protein